MEERITERVIYEEEEREIDLKQLFWTVLKRWRLILIVTVLCTAIGAAYPFLQKQQRAEVVVEETSTYEADLEAYEASVAYYESLIEGDRALAEKRQEYETNSIYARIDPFNEGYAQAVLTVRREAEQLQLAEGLALADPEAVNILQFYLTEVSDDSYLNPLAEELDTETAYLSELISAGADANRPLLNLSTIAPDMATADRILDAVIRHLQDSHTGAVSTFGEHELQVLGRSSRSRIDMALYSTQVAAVGTLQSLDGRIVANQAALDKLVEPVKPAAPVVVQGAIAVRPTVSSIVRYALIGFAGGLFAILFLLAIAAVLGNRVMSAGEFNRRYHLRALTMLPASSGKKRGGFDRWLSSRGEDRVYAQMPEEERLAQACANLSVYAPEAKDIVLVGQIGKAALDTLAGRLSAQITDKAFHAAPNINENAASLETLKQYDHVILAEQIHASRYADIDREIQVLRNWNKNVIGSVVLEQG